MSTMSTLHTMFESIALSRADDDEENLFLSVMPRSSLRRINSNDIDNRIIARVEYVGALKELNEGDSLRSALNCVSSRR